MRETGRCWHLPRRVTRLCPPQREAPTRGTLAQIADRNCLDLLRRFKLPRFVLQYLTAGGFLPCLAGGVMVIYSGFNEVNEQLNWNASGVSTEL